MKKILLVVILLHFQCILLSKLDDFWTYEFNDDIKLRPGILTKITLEFKSYVGEENDAEQIYKLSIKENKDIISSFTELIIDPKKDITYPFYIGLKCQKYTKEKISLVFNTFILKNGTDTPLNYDKLEDISLTLEIEDDDDDDDDDEDFKKIKIEPVIREMPGKSINYFKLKNEIFNVDKITIKAKKNDGLVIKDIIIEPFLNRDKISEENSANNGIFFDYPFGINRLLEKDEIYEIEFEGIGPTAKECFALNEKKFKIKVTKEAPTTFDDKVKNKIVESIDDQTSKYDIMNSILLKAEIETFPSILICKFKPSFSDLQYSSNDKAIKMFKTFITEKENDIIVNNLEIKTEYYSYCELSNTVFEEKERKKISISIGNFESADKKIKLMSSFDENRTPQCARFTFKNRILNFYANTFTLLFKCYKYMKEDEYIWAKGLPTIICQITEFNEKYTTVCVAPLPLSNLGKIISKEENNNFNLNFEKFIQDIEKYVLIEKTERIIDTEIKQSSFNSQIINSNNKEKDLYINISVSSSHIYPVQCFYNSDLTENFKFNLYSNYINLNPEENQTLAVKIPHPINNKKYSLYLKCFNNLPNFGFRYKTSGIMNIYTYNYNEPEDEKTNSKEINCNDITILRSPKCLEEKISILNELKTDLPSVIKELKQEVQNFINLEPKNKDKVLEEKYKDLVNNKIKQNLISNLNNLIKFIQFLTNKECSISSNDKEVTIDSDQYRECRNRKKNYLERIINDLKTKFDFFKCTNLNLAVQNLTSDVELNLKYILVFINELTKNPESYNKELSSTLYDTILCLEDNFGYYLDIFSAIFL